MTNESRRLEIANRVTEICDQHGVKVLMAVESGSRAYGYNAPNADYDVRFIYQRPMAWYLSVNERRDVIETPFKGDDLDIVGWDLKKALFQLQRGNPQLFEWLSQGDDYYLWVAHRMKGIIELAPRFFNPRSAIFHYLHMASGNYRQYIVNKTIPLLKKYLCVVRPLLVCGYIMDNNQMPSIKFDQVWRYAQDHDLSLTEDVVRDVEWLLAMKQDQAERQTLERIPRLDKWCEERFEFFNNHGRTAGVAAGNWDLINDLFFLLAMD